MGWDRHGIVKETNLELNNGEKMKAEDHVSITEKAIELFQNISSSKTSQFFFENMEAIKKGSEDADAPSYERAANWHFYNDNCGDKILTEDDFGFFKNISLHRTSEYIIQKRDFELSKSIQESDNKKICEYIGRILHHIQDMTTPSHVTPVYHGLIVKDSFETYLHENMLQEESPLRKNIAVQPKEYEALQINNCFAIYREAAEETLRYLYSGTNTFTATVNGKAQQLGWNYFWQRNADEHPDSYEPDGDFDGFGKFGPLGKNFGDVKEFDRKGVTYKIETQEYEKLCKYLVHKMTLDSLRVLKSLEKRMGLERIIFKA